MKTNKIIIVVLSLVLFLISCKKRDMNVLQAETQNESFGCMLNNKVWVNEGASYSGVAGLNIYIYQYNFGISAVKSNTNTGQEFSFNINQPLKVGKYYFNTSTCNASFSDLLNRSYFQTDSTQNWGTLEITKYDTIQKKVMGRFSFRAPRSYFNDTTKIKKDSIITITEGRFNIMY